MTLTSKGAPGLTGKEKEMRSFYRVIKETIIIFKVHLLWKSHSFLGSVKNISYSSPVQSMTPLQLGVVLWRAWVEVMCTIAHPDPETPHAWLPAGSPSATWHHKNWKREWSHRMKNPECCLKEHLPQVRNTFGSHISKNKFYWRNLF